MRALSLGCAGRALGVAGCGAASAEDTVKVGIARSTSNAAELMALKHGYFKEAGIKLEMGRHRHHGERHRAAGAEPVPDRRRRHLGRHLQRAGEGPSDHHPVRPRLDADRPQPDAAARPQGHGQEPQGPQGQGGREQRRRARSRPTRPARCWKARGSSSPTSTSRSSRSPRWARLQEQGDRRRHSLIPPFAWQSRGAGLRDPVRRRRRVGAAAADDHRGHHGQHRLGEGQPGPGAALHDGVAARRARILPSLSRRAEPPGDHRRAGQHQDRAEPRAAREISRGRRAARTARSTPRACSTSTSGTSRTRCRRKEFPADARGRFELHRRRGRRSSGRSSCRTRTASCRAAGDAHRKHRRGEA